MGGRSKDGPKVWLNRKRKPASRYTGEGQRWLDEDGRSEFARLQVGKKWAAAEELVNLCEKLWTV